MTVRKPVMPTSLSATAQGNRERDFQVKQDEEDGDQVVAHIELHPGVLESLEAAFIGGVLGLVRTTRAEQEAQQLGGDTDADANQNEKDDRQVLLNVHHDVGPQMEQIV